MFEPSSMTTDSDGPNRSYAPALTRRPFPKHNDHAAVAFRAGRRHCSFRGRCSLRRSERLQSTTLAATCQFDGMAEAICAGLSGAPSLRRSSDRICRPRRTLRTRTTRRLALSADSLHCQLSDIRTFQVATLLCAIHTLNRRRLRPRRRATTREGSMDRENDMSHIYMVRAPARTVPECRPGHRARLL
jgi:hypothetical protein